MEDYSERNLYREIMVLIFIKQWFNQLLDWIPELRKY